MANPSAALQLADMSTVDEAEAADALSPLSGHVTFQRSQSLPQISTERLRRPRTRFLSGRGGGSLEILKELGPGCNLASLHSFC
ncbi:hypothetical protein L596_008621 [Steinernema carpocapsae]|uniref:Uncharacterized protein n=1 Tax=Steinernema carpocapsae TaxID=34508 RepID=A0A4U5PDC0_STECR|nr:hypothetical protein L596_008621 [Steinernema carpocapsae]